MKEIPPHKRDKMRINLPSFFNSGSDKRYKEKIRPAKNGLTKVIKRPTMINFCFDFKTILSSIKMI